MVDVAVGVTDVVVGGVAGTDAILSLWPILFCD